MTRTDRLTTTEKLCKWKSGNETCILCKTQKTDSSQSSRNRFEHLHSETYPSQLKKCKCTTLVLGACGPTETSLIQG